MRILYLSNSANIGGGERSLLLIASGMQARGHQVTVVVPDSGRMLDACSDLNIPVVVRPYHQCSWKKPLALVRDLWSWRSLLATYRPQVVHANDLFTARSALLATRVRQVPLVAHIRYPPSTDSVRWAFRGLPKPSAFIFNSQALLSELEQPFRSSCARAKHFMLHNAVDLSRFRPNKQSEGKQRIGIVANLVPVKGHDDFLRMAHIVHQQFPEAEFWVVGDDILDLGMRTSLELLAQELGVETCVRFLGHRGDIPQLLNQMDILVCASTVEPFGRCLIEAMACETPVVATRVGGIPEVVADKATGILVPPRAPEELARAVSRLLQSPAQMREMGRAGFARAVNLFGKDTHIDRLLQIYNDLPASTCQGASSDRA